MWDWVIRAKRTSNLLPVLENVLAGFGKNPSHKRLTAPVQAKPSPKIRPPRPRSSIHLPGSGKTPKGPAKVCATYASTSEARNLAPPVAKFGRSKAAASPCGEAMASPIRSALSNHNSAMR